MAWIKCHHVRCLAARLVALVLPGMELVVEEASPSSGISGPCLLLHPASRPDRPPVAFLRANPNT